MLWHLLELLGLDRRVPGLRAWLLLHARRHQLHRLSAWHIPVTEWVDGDCLHRLSGEDLCTSAVRGIVRSQHIGADIGAECVPDSDAIQHPDDVNSDNESILCANSEPFSEAESKAFHESVG